MKQSTIIIGSMVPGSVCLLGKAFRKIAVSVSTHVDYGPFFLGFGGGIVLLFSKLMMRSSVQEVV